MKIPQPIPLIHAVIQHSYSAQFLDIRAEKYQVTLQRYPISITHITCRVHRMQYIILLAHSRSLVDASIQQIFMNEMTSSVSYVNTTHETEIISAPLSACDIPLSTPYTHLAPMLCFLLRSDNFFHSNTIQCVFPFRKEYLE